MVNFSLMHHLGTDPQGGVFVTLTYDNDNIPADGSLKKREFSLWIKRPARRYHLIKSSITDVVSTVRRAVGPTITL